jgi:hypothetical protein
MLEFCCFQLVCVSFDVNMGYGESFVCIIAENSFAYGLLYGGNLLLVAQRKELHV